MCDVKDLLRLSRRVNSSFALTGLSFQMHNLTQGFNLRFDTMGT